MGQGMAWCKFHNKKQDRARNQEGGGGVDPLDGRAIRLFNAGVRQRRFSLQLGESRCVALRSVVLGRIR